MEKLSDEALNELIEDFEDADAWPGLDSLNARILVCLLDYKQLRAEKRNNVLRHGDRA